MKKVWYKSWWGIIIAVLFLPLFAFWWVWKQSKLRKSTKTISLVLLGGFNLLWYGVIVYACIASVGAPVLDKIKSPTEQQVITVSGSNVASNAQVKLFLNGNEFQEVKADSKGKFSFLNVSLIEGENKVKASTFTKEGKPKESSEVKVVYQKPKVKEESSNQQTETPKQTETAQTTTEEPKQKNTIVSITRDEIVALFPELNFSAKTPVDGQENFVAQSSNKLVLIQIIGLASSPTEFNITTTISPDTANESEANAKYREKLLNKLTPNLGMFPDITKEKDSKTIDGFNVEYVYTSFGSGVFSESYTFNPVN